MLSGRHLLSSLSRFSRTLHPTWRTRFSRVFCSSTAPEKPYNETTRNIPKYQLQPIDKFFLVVTGTMKRGEIPDEVSFEVVEKSQNRRRIMVNILTIFLTIIGSAFAIHQGRKARDYHTEDTMFEKNVKRYEKLRAEDAKKEAEKATSS